MPLILTLGRQKQTDLYGFEASLIHRKFQDSQGTEKPCLKNPKEKIIIIITAMKVWGVSQ